MDDLRDYDEDLPGDEVPSGENENMEELDELGNPVSNFPEEEFEPDWDSEDESSVESRIDFDSILGPNFEFCFSPHGDYNCRDKEMFIFFEDFLARLTSNWIKRFYELNWSNNSRSLQIQYPTKCLQQIIFEESSNLESELEDTKHLEDVPPSCLPALETMLWIASTFEKGYENSTSSDNDTHPSDAETLAILQVANSKYLDLKEASKEIINGNNKTRKRMRQKLQRPTPPTPNNPSIIETLPLPPISTVHTPSLTTESHIANAWTILADSTKHTTNSNISLILEDYGVSCAEDLGFLLREEWEPLTSMLKIAPRRMFIQLMLTLTPPSPTPSADSTNNEMLDLPLTRRGPMAAEVRLTPSTDSTNNEMHDLSLTRPGPLAAAEVRPQRIQLLKKHRDPTSTSPESKHIYQYRTPKLTPNTPPTPPIVLVGAIVED